MRWLMLAMLMVVGCDSQEVGSADSVQVMEQRLACADFEGDPVGVELPQLANTIWSVQNCSDNTEVCYVGESDWASSPRYTYDGRLVLSCRGGADDPAAVIVRWLQVE